MRYDKAHKEETRRKIIAVAARRFREEGVAAVGVASLMADAGLTHGGFYAHFASKEDLVRATLDQSLDESLANLLKIAAKSDNPIDGFVRAYLSRTHRDHAGAGCAVAALSAEIARHEIETRAIFGRKLDDYVDAIAGLLGDSAMARPHAMALYGLLSGSLQLARACADPQDSDEILTNAIAAARLLTAHHVSIVERSAPDTRCGVACRASSSQDDSKRNHHALSSDDSN